MEIKPLSMLFSDKTSKRERHSVQSLHPKSFFPLGWTPWKLGVLTLILLGIEVVVVAMQPSISQDLKFHNFADGRSILNIENFWNVTSNLGFLAVGFAGLYKMLIRKSLVVMNEFRAAYIIFFIGICLVTAGSSYYHFNPDNYTLVWDRLPMTIAFMALSAISFGEFMSVKVARLILWPLLLFGLSSIYYWYYGERSGHGDLRLYALVQLTPVLLLPLLLIAGKRTFDIRWGYLALLASYIVANFFEYYDVQIFQMTSSAFGGHAMKHLSIATGLYFLIRSYELRKRSY